MPARSADLGLLSPWERIEVRVRGLRDSQGWYRRFAGARSPKSIAHRVGSYPVAKRRPKAAVCAYCFFFGPIIMTI